MFITVYNHFCYLEITLYYFFNNFYSDYFLLNTYFWGVKTNYNHYIFVLIVNNVILLDIRNEKQIRF